MSSSDAAPPAASFGWKSSWLNPRALLPSACRAVVGEVVRESAPHEDLENTLEVVDDHRAHRGPLLDHRGRPFVSQEHAARREDPLTEGRLPVLLRRRALENRDGIHDLADHDLDSAVEQGGLVVDVVVERHRLDAEVLSEVAHRERLDAALIGQVDRAAQDPLATER